MLYKYITNDNLYEKQTYMYSEYNGKEFLEAYSMSRKSFGNGLTDEEIENDYASDATCIVRRDLYKLYKALETGRIDQETKEKIDGYVKSFEVRKRIYTAYDSKWKPIEDASFEDYESYVIFSKCLVLTYRYTDCLKYLNCLLKLNDTLLSLKNKLNSLSRLMLSESLKSELGFVDRLALENEIIEKENKNNDVIVLEDFALLASNTTRTKAYIQMMIQECKHPGICIVYVDDIAELEKEAKEYISKEVETEYFDADKPILVSLKEEGIAYKLVEEKDINSENMYSVLNQLKQKYLIYSGYGGYILKPHLFKMDKKILHVHAGILPSYRGSTTVYYSYLQERRFGATAIFLNEGIDEGEIIAQDTFEAPEKPVNIDYIYDPYIRAKVLMKAVEKYLSNGDIQSKKQEVAEETYFIIHPVLKHIALLGIEKRQNEHII